MFVTVQNQTGVAIGPIYGLCGGAIMPVGCPGTPPPSGCSPTGDIVLGPGTFSFPFPALGSTPDLAVGAHAVFIDFSTGTGPLPCCLPVTVRPGVSSYGPSGAGVAGQAPQLVVADPSSMGGFSHSQGLQIPICSD